MGKFNVTARCLAVLGAATALPLLALAATAQDSLEFAAPVLKKADPNERGGGTLSSAAKAAIEHGPLPMSDADVAAKAAADREREEAEKKGAQRHFSLEDLARAGKPGATPLLNIVGFDKPGLDDFFSTPPDTTGAIGPTRYIQLVNSRAGIFNRTSGALIDSGSLNALADLSFEVRSFDPQIIWDSTTNRFYYVMDSIFSSSDHRLSWGFSKTADPGNILTDFCHYTMSFHTKFPDFPKLGQSQFFSIIGYNGYKSDKGSDNGFGFVGSALLAISKPPEGTVCPAADRIQRAGTLALHDSTGALVFTPVPSNQIDTNPTGYVVARNLSLPSDKLWFFDVTRDALGFPEFGPARGVTVPPYAVPASASQPQRTQVLDTSDARNTQAVQAIDPRLGKFAFWTQHTIKSETVSIVRWYEIDPVPATPIVLHTGFVGAPETFVFNGAISPDRVHDSHFGDRFVIEYNVSGLLSFAFPSILAASGVNGTLNSFLVVSEGRNPYWDFSCPNSGDKCRWGDYSAATPDPRPTPLSRIRGVVWGTNQFSRVFSPFPFGAEWRTVIFALEP